MPTGLEGVSHRTQREQLLDPIHTLMARENKDLYHTKPEQILVLSLWMHRVYTLK